MNAYECYTLTSDDWAILARFGNPHRYEDDAIRDDEKAQDFRFEMNWGVSPSDYIQKRCPR